MSRKQWESNLNSHCQRLNDYMTGSTGLAPQSDRAIGLSKRIYLSHATTVSGFSKSWQGGALISAAALARKMNTTLPSNRLEVRMGTAGCVFLFAAPFRYPDTSCGFLFAPTLEEERTVDGAASPFDSGGLDRNITFPKEYATAPDFLYQHEFPLPEHRNYLRLSMENLFSRPEDYIEGVPPKDAGCLGLAGGDSRRWTHEVRIPDRILLRGSHLQAVFAPRSLVSADPQLEEMFTWCKDSGVERIYLDAPVDGDFEKLKAACVTYIQATLYNEGINV